MIGALIAKDLQRTRRNPLPWMINLLIPLLIVTLIGSFFGGKDTSQGLGTIHFAFVDEDGSKLVEFLKGSLNSEDARKHLDPVFLDRAAAEKQLTANKLSAMVVVPAGFTQNLLDGKPTQLELVKNPAEQINPTVMEELMGILVAGLNGVSRNFSEELPLLKRAMDGERSVRLLAELTIIVDDKLEGLKSLHSFPLVSYTTESRAGEKKGDERPAGFNLFGYLIAGLSSMFLLFLANTGMTDLHREVQMHTLERFATHHVSLAPLIMAKIVYVFIMLLLCIAILYGGSALAFGIAWQHPAQLVLLQVGYALCVTSMMACLVALIPNQRQSESFASVINMMLGLAGGCAFPPNNLPPIIREHIMPWIPTAWFSEGVRHLEFDAGYLQWQSGAVRLFIAAVVFTTLASFLLRRRFASGLRA